MYWSRVNGEGLAQGDVFANCAVPLFGPDFGKGGDGSSEAVDVAFATLIVTTQSCDLENDKVTLVALCPIYTLSELNVTKATWNEIRKRRQEGMHMLGNPDDHSDPSGALVVDFRQIISLPMSYLKQKAAEPNLRLRLVSPYVEDFSQSFGRFFMRVALPHPIPQLK